MISIGRLLRSGTILCIMGATGGSLWARSASELPGTASRKKLLATALDNSGRLFFAGDGTIRRDTVHVYALRVRFDADTSTLTTGTGNFGDFREKDESRYYRSDTVYRYDRLPHDSLYFANQLRYARDYFATVSRGRLTIDFTVGPEFAVPRNMPFYSPGGKKKKETYDHYYERKFRGLMQFVVDAILTAGADTKSPFRFMRYENGVFRDSLGRKTVFLVFHAGASVLTDGGPQGYFGIDTPSDMLDVFIARDYFEYYVTDLRKYLAGSGRDSNLVTRTGVTVNGAGGDRLMMDELMLVSETSNQDSLNWGIHGVLINQIARQIGIPDLFSASSGSPAIGAFCIMDFAGYSAGKGFIPPWPSAWVRAFMGWDIPVIAAPGISGTYRVKAIGAADSTGRDTTILLVPINDHEYYLVENRQRNLDGSASVFNYDTVDNTPYIAGYPYNVSIDSSVVATDGTKSKTILKVKNYDVSLPASGVLVWHIDEQIVRDRLRWNYVNADSSYRGVRLVEADGVDDLGVTFTDVFYQAAFDYGGAQDVFPHRTISGGKTTTVDSLGPWTRPNTRANDGGHSYLKIGIKPASGAEPAEKSAVRDYFVANFRDSVFQVSVDWDFLVPGWPRRMVPDTFFEPVLCDLHRSSPGRELAVVSKSQRLYVWPGDGSHPLSFGAQIDSVPVMTARQSDTTDAAILKEEIRSLRVPTVPGFMPSAIDGKLFIPGQKRVHILTELAPERPDSAVWQDVVLPAAPSSPVSKIDGSFWAVGLSDGRIFAADAGSEQSRVIALSSSSPVCALAALSGEKGMLVCMQEDGTVTVANASEGTISASTPVRNGIGPYTIVTGDLDRVDGRSEIVISDSRHGLWVFTRDLRVAPGWEEAPIDWASVYIDPAVQKDRTRYPVNTAPPALADINGDGCLDIVTGGTNGLYALNYKGVLIYGWPAYLDNRFWYQRRSITSSPVVAADRNRAPLVLFGSPTGENATFAIRQVDRIDRDARTVYFTFENGLKDSIGELTISFLDSLTTYGDSLILPYVLPGGFIDAVNGRGKRPATMQNIWNTGTERQSYWPITTGGPTAGSPLLGDLDGDGSLDIVAVSENGWVYRWELGTFLSPDSLFWPQAGADNGRSFSYRGLSLGKTITEREPIEIFSYPNPTRGSPEVVFRFKFNGPAQNVRLDIYTYTGYHVYSWRAEPGRYTTHWQDWNEYALPPSSFKRFGPAVYRCRLEATVNGKKHHRYWKMAVTK